MRYSSNKDINRLIMLMILNGWKHVHGAKHDKLISGKGRVLVIARTPSDWRAIRNIKCAIQRNLRETT